ncbi:MAG: class I SAM-dependent RNA methyltransferase, partial [Planctomycetes bacterium]|nr:class I SAM-dependent RNA methyltransferase [Planctomycetota bacterium]
MSSPSAAFAACLPGLEPLLAAELRELGADPRPAAGGVGFDADLELLLRCGLWLGTASHVLLRVAEFRCRALGELERKAAALPWAQWLRDDVAVQVTATARRSRLFHTGAITERVERSIQGALGELPAHAPDSDAPVARIAVRFEDDH